MKKQIFLLVMAGTIITQLLLPNIITSANTDLHNTNKLNQIIASKINMPRSYTDPVITQALTSPKDFICSKEITLNLNGSTLTSGTKVTTNRNPILKVTNVTSRKSNCKLDIKENSKIISVSMKGFSTCSVYSEGNIYIWGNNTNRKIVAGRTTNRYTTVKIKDKDVTRAKKLSINEIDNLIKEIGGSIKNHPLRQKYENAVKNLSNYEVKLRSKGLDEKEVAQSMHQARRNLGVKYQNLTPAALRDYIYEINMKRYNGDPLGGSFEFFENKYMGDYSKIIDSAKRPNGNVDKLLKNFKEWLIEKNT